MLFVDAVPETRLMETSYSQIISDEGCGLPFATTSYETDQDGTLCVVLPSRCVYATGEQTCAIFVDHYRKRKTGPATR